MRSLNTTIVKLTLILLLGVLAGFYIDPSLSIVFFSLGLSFTMFITAYIRAKKLIFKDGVFGYTCYLLFFTTGIFTTTIHQPKTQKHHFVKMISSEKVSNIEFLKISIREVLKPDLYNKKYIAKVEAVNQDPAHGKILVLFPKDSSEVELNVGDRFLISSEIKDIPAPMNPHQFDYSRFMANRGVLKQIKVNPDSYMVLPSSSGLFGKAHFWRKKIISDLKRDGFKSEELAIVQALLLGQKQDISTETYNDYAAAGAIHILAVSGLHVGILLFLLNWLFSPFNRIKKGKYIKSFLVIISLWGFALLSGLSPSVIRAVTMFSFLAIGMEINRRTSSLNSLFLSLLVLVLIQPNWIFEVGFQLSYAAVLAIFLLQPLLYNVWQPGNKIVKYAWGLLTTTIAAQIGVLPLGLFYFHQFPGLFFLSNLVILPFLGIILGLGILIILFSLLNFLPEFLTEGYSLIIRNLNSFVSAVAREEQFLFRDVPFSITEVWAFYFLIISLIFFAYSGNFRRLISALLAVIILQSVYLVKASMPTAEEGLIIFHKSHGTIIGQRKQEKLLVHQISGTPESSAIPQNYVTGEGIEEIVFKKPQNVYSVQSDILLVIDSTGVYPKLPDKIKYLLLTGSPKVNLYRVIEDLDPQMILADGNNYPSQVRRWKETCRKKKLPFHYTGGKGAYIIKSPMR